MSARLSIQRVARERVAVDPDRITCPECRGSGKDEWGRCNNCDGHGSWEREAHTAYRLGLSEQFRAGVSPLDRLRNLDRKGTAE